MCIIYVAGSFRGKNSWEIHNNVLKAERAMVKLIGEGYTPICPHKMTENLQGLYPDQVYLDMCLEFLKVSDAIYVLDNWKQSKGTQVELREAINLGLDIIYEEV